MTVSDTILFVKETRTCSYVLVIHTPRLCAEPGFRSPLEAREEALVRCREVVPTLTEGNAYVGLPEASNPSKVPFPRQKVVGMPAPPPPAADQKAKGNSKDQGAKKGSVGGGTHDAVRRALESLLGIRSGGGDRDGQGREGAQIVDMGENGEFVIELDLAQLGYAEDGEELEWDESEGVFYAEDVEEWKGDTGKKKGGGGFISEEMAEELYQQGYDRKGNKIQGEEKEENKKTKKEKAKNANRDEL